jgi:ATP-dependent DNA helicase RecQ
MAFPAERAVHEVLATLSANDGPTSTQALETTVDLRRGRLEAMLKVLDVDGAVRRVKGGWTATGAPWTYDAERYARVADVRRREQQAMRDYVATENCRMEFLRRQLDDPEATSCGRCDNCTHRSFDGATDEASLSSARHQLSRAGVPIEPKKLWPASMSAFDIDVRGRIAETEGADTGRALGRLTGIGLGAALRSLLAEGTADDAIEKDLLDATVKVLAEWKEQWPERPAAVVSIGSHRRPTLINSLAQGIAAIGRLPYLGVVEHTGASAGEGSNSAHRFRSVWDAYRLPPETEARLRDHAGTAVLLVDDFLDSGWTMTVVTRLLRNAGASRVYPLVLAVTY